MLNIGDTVVIISSLDGGAAGRAIVTEYIEATGMYEVWNSWMIDGPMTFSRAELRLVSCANLLVDSLSQPTQWEPSIIMISSRCRTCNTVRGFDGTPREFVNRMSRLIGKLV